MVAERRTRNHLRLITIDINMKMTKKQLRQIIKEEKRKLLSESVINQGALHDAILDFIYRQLPDADLEAATPTILAALNDVINTINSPEANPHDGGMYGEEAY